MKALLFMVSMLVPLMICETTPRVHPFPAPVFAFGPVFW
jgi:hypothetical protein